MRIFSRMLPLLTALALLISTSAFARALTTEEKVRDFEQLVSMIKAGYGPLEYKKVAIGKDIDWLHSSYLVKVVQTQTNVDFYYLLNQFIAEFQDSHFSGSIPTDHRGILGFYADLVGDKVVVEEAFLPIGLEKGDEIVSFNGRPVSEELAKIQKYIGMGRPETAKRISAILLGIRNARSMPVPNGDVVLGVRKIASGQVSDMSLQWHTVGTPLTANDTFEPEEIIDFEVASFDPRSFKISIKDRMDELMFKRSEATYMCSGATRIAIPEDATIIMETPFVAYYHAHPARPDINIGYLRIPHYMPAMDGEGEEDPFQMRFDQYEYAVSILEDNTAGLIIDQDHNCGGSVFYLEKLVGLFANAPYNQMQFEFLANRVTALEFQGYLDMMSPHTLFYQNFKVTADLIHNSWLSGESFLTPKTGFLGTMVHQPHYISYSKPIVMLIDEMSGSGGDAFPSILGGIGRARLMGRATMGAGGHVEPGTPLYNSAHTMSMTKSLFYRPDGVAVENNGAEPHVEYIPTMNDYMNKYVDYQAAYLEEVLALIDGDAGQ